MVPTFKMIGRPDACFAWDGTGFHHHLSSAARAHDLEGAFAGTCREPDGGISVVRDPLGLNKLYWVDAGGHVELASCLYRLTNRGHPLDACAAIPANAVITYRAKTPPTVAPVTNVPCGGSPAPAEQVDTVAARIRDAVSRFVEGLLTAHPGPIFVCLSGGLDSTSLAALVREHRDDVVAVTFDLTRPCGCRSDDFLAARQAARYVGLDLVPSLHTPESVLDLLDVTLAAGGDWRDFNVHAGLVNAALATTISDLVDRPLATMVITGDLVNEFLADYHAETYNGTTYYPLPRLPVSRLRRALVGGLQGTHREIGVFGQFGLTAVQPYAAARQHLLQVPETLLGAGRGKQLLYRHMFGTSLPSIAYERPKTRSQTGSEHGHRGVLGVCADAGIDRKYLRRRFAHLHHVTGDGALDWLMRGGRLRTAIPRGDDDTTA